MAHVKAAGTSKNLKDSKPKMLGVKIYGNQFAKTGDIIIRQRGQKYRSGDNTQMGKDHTIFAMKPGKVNFQVRRVNKDGIRTATATFVSVT
ncbi:TPA: 50S ribosomal protein L27 [Patescibacteria group bacterium]|uniref:Large ribosomal subunit protein bL27 n=1 Tax=candidate division Kazan bacterium GW2011_GWA1_50_15 TaxID=1620412 RepID=A0A0G4BCH8_UNCK3|nr:MAG: 50S ribosomal protein L27, large subunit ribosomal protein L27 [candidate division Kazan bacterium GW2011_GWA1_50_15]HAV65751.1 50S ribosomal protein L27 [Patescibacteria group bacterium]HCL47761.1 50S ribosomal protein L27 [Patescibacteria group bacterium]HCR42839.1 50S ribosomal protein L27 [Patescibacteria group bacterium]